jgi:sirohydrochlorin ferrochelatase
MKALVLVAHGSRRQASNEEVTALSELVSNRMADDFPIIEAGFLELAEPSIFNAIDRCVQQGATDISVLPYFLSAGRHVQHDVPAEINNAKAIHPGIPMLLLPHIGGSPQMIELIRGSVTAA